ncbi:ketosteroid isomerase family protein [Mycolicibacter sinensis]|uniref:Transporter n=1 Tax=Mycolicibacter sinensis (strain JDM601) TaxID=875328 RepID=A0A1A2Y7B9_MYCSD|nr:ketosteroid isomerase family protein [Mycolicibacter sinensis]OBH20246.1 transporter [Mycolicibacter sinensis]OBI33192.1 transporter [Mycolicibacter sinensis]
MTDSIAQDLLVTVEQSPAAAAAHDRSGWVGLFSSDGQVEDPVGSRPHVGAQQIGRFYDTFIGPRDITFHRDLDIVHGTTVIRDLQLEVAMGPSVVMHIPAILRYDLTEDLTEAGSRWKLRRLRAYWELPAMMRQFLGNGLAAVPAGVGLSRSLLRNQRLAGSAGFAAGFRRPAGRGKHPVRTFLTAISSGQLSTVTAALSPTATMTYGDDTAIDLAELGARLDGARPTKLLAAGGTVAVSMTSAQQRAVLFADVDRRGQAMTAIRYFAQA